MPCFVTKGLSLSDFFVLFPSVLVSPQRPALDGHIVPFLAANTRALSASFHFPFVFLSPLRPDNDKLFSLRKGRRVCFQCNGLWNSLGPVSVLDRIVANVAGRSLGKKLSLTPAFLSLSLATITTRKTSPKSYHTHHHRDNHQDTSRKFSLTHSPSLG